MTDFEGQLRALREQREQAALTLNRQQARHDIAHADARAALDRAVTALFADLTAQLRACDFPANHSVPRPLPGDRYECRLVLLSTEDYFSCERHVHGKVHHVTLGRRQQPLAHLTFADGDEDALHAAARTWVLQVLRTRPTTSGQ
ncbi:hypothetical protein [Deinococcus maricopensis]|uniref:Uncharacterized protein n=1 Tax=Deinococcus maricopensis (strain DSM 21211 / LMG 22137 / NRRL B-23946 / LB-34) TaxID=709986 RepID=E8UBD3_DEIML|nr:hypothetical protein [Deinococcus maricopensis]ADV68372.1 hypothetical protein Deima_2742 [Deinococcus maricopensis DSM 21211]